MINVLGHIIGIAMFGGLLSDGQAGQGQDGQTSCWYFEGNVGANRIGGEIEISDVDHLTIKSANYFYVARLIDIPLAASVVDRVVTLREPNGGYFTLNFRGSGIGSSKPPFTFYNSNGLVGTWRSGNRTLPAKINVNASGGCPGGPRYMAVVGRNGRSFETNDRAFEAMVARFLHGAITGNVAEVVKSTHFPLYVNASKPYKVRNEQELRRHWKAIFTPQYLEKLKMAVPHNLFVHEGNAMVGIGEVWFDDRGAIALNR